jgi:hypothetical protein
MNVQHRIEILEKLGNYILSDNSEWKSIKERAVQENTWFVPEFIDLAVQHIGNIFLQSNPLHHFAQQYSIPSLNSRPKNVGIVMAGNIPLVGFHDLLCTFLSGHRQTIKPSSKDQVLIKHLVQKMTGWDGEMASLISFAEMLKGCDAYIATGSNNSSRYFEKYFGKYPHIIRRNRTSIAILEGNETINELEKLADDVYQYFGLGCRNVTKIYVPAGYDFVPLLETFKKYNYLADHHKYKNNYDYQLAILIINKRYYMTNGSIVLHEDPQLFSPISQLNYEFYTPGEELPEVLLGNEAIQCIVGKKYLPFGSGQQPGLTDFADGVDTLKFLLDL